MESKSGRHENALYLAKEKILNSKLAGYVEELYLFGSMARNQIKWNSDIDLLLVLDSEKVNVPEIKKEIICTNQTFYNNILREGKKIL